MATTPLMALMTSFWVTVLGSLVEGGRRLIVFLVADVSLVAPVAALEGVETAWLHRMFGAVRFWSRGEVPAFCG